MTLRKIARLGHPVLRTRAAPVGDPTRSEIVRLVADMIETMHDAGGVGLAAPQVYEPLRLVVALPVRPDPGGEVAAPLVIVDPELSPLDGEEEDGVEGCLSIPGLRGVVRRWRRVAWRGRDRDGGPIGGTADGLLARVLQHEVDHLDGILYPMRMHDLGLLAMDSELAHLQARMLSEGNGTR